MKKSVVSLALLLLASVLGPSLSTTPFNNDNDNDKVGETLQVHPLESLQLTLSQATSLCEGVSKSGIENGQLYQWIPVRKQQQEESQSEPVSAPSEQQIQQQVKEEENAGGCLKIGFTPCLGKARFPLKSDCGFFSFIFLKEEECSSSSRSKRSISAGSMSLSHGEALHLCHTIRTALPTSPEQVNYVALKIHDIHPHNFNSHQRTENEKDNQVQIPHPSENCVAWSYKPCMKETQVDCNVWHKKVKSTEKCTRFHSQDPAHHPKHPQISSLDPKLRQEISSSSLPEMSQVVQCQSTDLITGSIQCHVLPVGTEISTDNSHQHTREKRYSGRTFGCPIGMARICCCGIFKCHCCCSTGGGGGGGGHPPPPVTHPPETGGPDQPRWWWDKK